MYSVKELHANWSLQLYGLASVSTGDFIDHKNMITSQNRMEDIIRKYATFIFFSRAVQSRKRGGKTGGCTFMKNTK